MTSEVSRHKYQYLYCHKVAAQLANLSGELVWNIWAILSLLKTFFFVEYLSSWRQTSPITNGSNTQAETGWEAYTSSTTTWHFRTRYYSLCHPDMAGKNCSAGANTPLKKVQLTRRGRPLWWLKGPRPGRNGQRPAWNPAGAFPTCLQLPLQISQVCIIWDILESVYIRYPLGEVHQIWEVRRELTMSGNPQPGLSATRQLHSHFLLSPNICLLPLQETPTLLSNSSFSLSLSFSIIY